MQKSKFKNIKSNFLATSCTAGNITNILDTSCGSGNSNQKIIAYNDTTDCNQFKYYVLDCDASPSPECRTWND